MIGGGISLGPSGARVRLTLRTDRRRGENPGELVNGEVNELLLWEKENRFPDRFLLSNVRGVEFPIPLHVIINFLYC